MFYWSPGRDLDTIKGQYEWGSGFYRAISEDIKHQIPDFKSFSPRNLLYAPVYRLYSLGENTPQNVAQSENTENAPQLVAHTDIFSVSWVHHRFIIIDLRL